MCRILAALLCVLSLGVAHPTVAAVFERDWKTPGDGLLTFDDVNQREWLDLTETQLFKFPGGSLDEQFDAVVSELVPGGTYHSFSVGTDNDVRELTKSGSIDVETRSFQSNGVSSANVIKLLGNTMELAGSTENRRAGGFVAAARADLASVWVVFTPEARGERHAGFRDLSGNLEPSYGFVGPPPSVESSGVWLYRAVPEPTACTLIFVALFSSWTLRRRASRWTRLATFAHTVLVAVAVRNCSALDCEKGHLQIIEADPRGNVTALHFSGDATWLEAQKDPRSHWHTLPKLSRLVLEQHRITAGEFTYIATFPHITKLQLGVFPDPVEFETGSISRLQRLQQLESLSIFAKGLAGVDWSLLPSPSNLRYLSVGGSSGLDDSFLKAVSKAEAIEQLEIEKGKFSAEGIRSLSELGKLRHLRLTTSVPARQIEDSLIAMNQLEILEISAPDFTEAIVKRLKAMPNLQQLRVNGTWKALRADYIVNGQ